MLKKPHSSEPSSPPPATPLAGDPPKPAASPPPRTTILPAPPNPTAWSARHVHCEWPVLREVNFVLNSILSPCANALASLFSHIPFVGPILSYSIHLTKSLVINAPLAAASIPLNALYCIVAALSSFKNHGPKGQDYRKDTAFQSLRLAPDDTPEKRDTKWRDMKNLITIGPMARYFISNAKTSPKLLPSPFNYSSSTKKYSRIHPGPLNSLSPKALMRLFSPSAVMDFNGFITDPVSGICLRITWLHEQHAYVLSMGGLESFPKDCPFNRNFLIAMRILGVAYSFFGIPLMFRQFDAVAALLKAHIEHYNNTPGSVGEYKLRLFCEGSSLGGAGAQYAGARNRIPTIVTNPLPCGVAMHFAILDFFNARKSVTQFTNTEDYLSFRRNLYSGISFNHTIRALIHWLGLATRANIAETKYLIPNKLGKDKHSGMVAHVFPFKEIEADLEAYEWHSTFRDKGALEELEKAFAELVINLVTLRKKCDIDNRPLNALLDRSSRFFTDDKPVSNRVLLRRGKRLLKLGKLNRENIIQIARETFPEDVKLVTAYLDD